MSARLLQIVAYFGGCGAIEPDVYFLPLDWLENTERGKYLYDLLYDEQGSQWRDVYQTPCDKEEIEYQRKKGYYDAELDQAWTDFDNLSFRIESGAEIPGRVVKYFIYRA